MRGFVAATLFRGIEVVLSPMAMVGGVHFAVSSSVVSRSLGVSETALASLCTRWMQHQLGTRLDEPCDRLMKVLPNVPAMGLRLAAGPTLLAHRVTGYVPEVFRYPYEHGGNPPLTHEPAARTTFFDAALDRHIGDIAQCVVLGAGNDTRSYRLPFGTKVRCFEVDTAKTQEFKREMLRKAGVEAARVTFVPADLMTDDWLATLVKAGFDPERPTFFLLEGVTMYLDREAVENVLRTIAGTASGSVVAFDYFTTDTIESQSLYLRSARAVLNAIGEPWTFGIESTPPARDQVAAFLKACGLSMDEQRNFGQETEHRHAVGGFVTAVV